MRLVNEDPSENDLAVYSAFTEWIDTYKKRDLDGMMARMDPDVFSVGTGIDEINRGVEFLREGFGRDFRETTEIKLLDGDVTVRSWEDWGWLFFKANYGVVVKGEQIRYSSRRTVVYRREGGRWIQCHVHHSIPDKGQIESRSFPVGPATANRYMLLFSSSRDGIVMASRRSRRILEANMAAVRMYGIPETGITEFSLDDLMPERELDLFLDRLEELPREGCLFESVHKGSDGHIPVEVSVKCSELDGRSVILLVVRDISDRLRTEKALRLSEERLRMAMEANEDILWELEIPTMSLYVDGMGGRFGERKATAYDKWKERIHPEDREKIDSALRGHLDRGEEFRVEHRILTAEGRWIWALSRGRLTDRDGGGPLRMLGTLMNIDRRKKIEEERASLTRKLEKLASIDKLTGILNRQRFEELLQERMDASKGASPLCLLMFDLDRFKDLNDSRGHQAGDRALMRVSESVSGRLRRDDLFCRWGGDEFMVALELDLGRSELVAEDLRKAIASSLEDGYSSLTASFGIAPWDGGISLEELTAQVDDALYRAKKTGRDRVVIFGCGEYN